MGQFSQARKYPTSIVAGKRLFSFGGVLVLQKQVQISSKLWKNYFIFMQRHAVRGFRGGVSTSDECCAQRVLLIGRYHTPAGATPWWVLCLSVLGMCLSRNGVCTQRVSHPRRGRRAQAQPRLQAAWPATWKNHGRSGWRSLRAPAFRRPDATI